MELHLRMELDMDMGCCFSLPPVEVIQYHKVDNGTNGFTQVNYIQNPAGSSAPIARLQETVLMVCMFV